MSDKVKDQNVEKSSFICHKIGSISVLTLINFIITVTCGLAKWSIVKIVTNTILLTAMTILARFQMLTELRESVNGWNVVHPKLTQ